MATTIVCDKKAEILFLFLVRPTRDVGFDPAADAFDLVIH